MSLVTDKKVDFQVSGMAPISDGQITQMATDEWVSVLMSMWEAIGKDVDEKRLTIYAKQFSIVPLGLLEKAVGRAIRNNGNYLTVPTVGALWDALRRELGNPRDIDQAIEQWCETS